LGGGRAARSLDVPGQFDRRGPTFKQIAER
jgi:hypothetical protein